MATDPVTTTVDMLAVARLARLVTIDDFPPIKAARDRFTKAVGADSSIAELVGCPWCASWWIGLGVVAVRRTRWWRPVAFALAASEVAGFLGIKSENLNGDANDVAESLDGIAAVVARTAAGRDMAVAELYGRVTGLERDTEARVSALEATAPRPSSPPLGPDEEPF